ncbi:hypothetical protein [Anaerospora sp.]|uniref:hypothetical protein n=1 Tax=Anaerospora sp. TaxID=1960278 RepID=UPI0028973EC6|nr:hypothetical protein [Anaerospora sp.]
MSDYSWIKTIIIGLIIGVLLFYGKTAYKQFTGNNMNKTKSVTTTSEKQSTLRETPNQTIRTTTDTPVPAQASSGKSQSSQDNDIRNNTGLQFNSFNVQVLPMSSVTKVARIKFTIENISDRKRILLLDDFVLRKPGANSIKVSRQGGGFDQGSPNYLSYTESRKDIMPGDNVKVSFDFYIDANDTSARGYVLYYIDAAKMVSVLEIK